MGFAWSYSKMKNFLTCQKRHYEVDLQKNYTDTGEAMEWGNRVHKFLADACIGKAPLPEKVPIIGEDDFHMRAAYQEWVDKYADPSLPGELLVERQYAMTKDFEPCSWFRDPRVWVRVIIDLLRIYGPVARSVDWKTGRMIHDSRQLMVSSQAIFAHHPEVKRVHTDFVWLQDGNVTTEVFNRADMVKEWPPVLDVIKEMENAAKTLTYPPKPSRLCFKHCPVQSCPFYGKRYNG